MNHLRSMTRSAPLALVLCLAAAGGCSDESSEPATGGGGFGGSTAGGSGGTGGATGGRGGAAGSGGIGWPAGPLTVDDDNPRYFADATGTPVYLTGSHTWPNLLDMGDTDPPAAFDYDAYLDLLDRHGHNFIRLWIWELTRYQYGATPRYASPQPWQRTGSATALDGKPAFDLDRFDQGYFDRLRMRVLAARDREMYVSIMLFEGHGVQRSDPPWCWDGHPLNAQNNVNGIDGNANGDARGLEIHTLDVAAVTNVQRAYVRQLIDTVNDLDNVLYEIANECFPGSTDWQYDMISYVKSYEATLPNQHPVGMTFQFQGGDNATLFASPADWISPRQQSGADYRDDPPAADGSKVILSDTDHLWGIGGDREWVWKSFARGLNPIYMDPAGDLGVVLSEPGDETIRAALGHTLQYARRMDLAVMLPHGELASTGYCLAEPGSGYLIYQPTAGSFTVDLVAGNYDLEWFDPVAGTVTDTGTVAAAGGDESFTPPMTGSAVLYLHR